MKKALKRSLSLLLAITIIFGSMYVGLSEVDFGGLFVVKAHAASLMKTKSEAVAWLKAQNGAGHDVDNAWGYQCADFAAAYMNWLVSGNPRSGHYTVSDAKNYPTIANRHTSRWQVIPNSSSFVPQPGDIFVSVGASPDHGHVGAVISSTANNATIVDQNFVNWNLETGSKAVIHDITWTGAYKPTYFIRPIFSDTPVVSLTTPTITFNKSSYTEGDTITLTWTPSPADSNLSHYWVRVTDSNGNVYVNNRVDKTKTSYSFITPGVGTFQVTTSATPYGSVSGEGSLTNTKSITVNAKISTYTVSYNANGGTGAPSAQTKYQNTALTLSSTKPTRSGYTFLGWSTSSTATSATYAAGGSYTANSGATLYAVWRINTYTVSYNANGGSSAPGAVSHSHGSTHTISSTIPERVGYIFNGWGTSSNASTIYSPGQNYTVTGNTTFYAQWASPGVVALNSTYTASISYAGDYKYYKFVPTFTLNYTFESTGSVDSLIKLYDSTGTELANNDDGGSDRNFLLNYTLQGGQTYYVKIYAYSNKTGNIPFTIKGLCNVTYDANGGADEPSSQTASAGESIYLSSSAPRRCGYTFIGWSESPNATTPQYQPGDAFSANNNVTLYAVWETSTMANYLEYEINWSNDGIEITGCDDTYEGVLVIPNIIDGYPVVRIAWYAFENCARITSITIPDSVTSIASSAFSGCSSLASITIPDSVTSIDSYAFENCTSLTSINIPDGITTIGWDTFYNCTSLTSITIPDSVTSIGSCAFYNCNNLTSITIPVGVTDIGYRAFYNCTSLTSITIPDGVTSIGDYTFYNCTNLASVILGSGIISIDEYGFSNCTSLTSITIPDSVISIGVAGFSGCTNLTTVTIGSGVKSIGGSAFSGCTSLTSITIPNNVTNLEGTFIFGDCKSLTSVIIGDGVTSIDACTFYYCTNLTSVTIGNGVTNIDGSAFSGCASLTSIAVDSANEYYSSIDGILFNKNKTELIKYTTGKSDRFYTIPDSVITIGESAFSGCTSLISITIPDSVTSIGYMAFARCTNLFSVTIPDSVTNLDNFTFYDCTSLTSVVIGDGVTSTGSSAFNGCTNLTSVMFGNSITNIGSNAFDSCTSLTSITIPVGVTDIDYRTFYNCSSLTSITIPEGVTSIGDDAFRNCTSLTSVTIPDSVTSIGGTTFAGCSNLSSISIGSGVTSIGGSAFGGCTSLTSITIPNSVTNISDSAFSGCTSLVSIVVDSANEYYSSVDGLLFNKTQTELVQYPAGKTDIFYTIHNGVTSIGSWAFAYCSNLTSITIPNSVTSIGYRTFYNCTNLTSVTFGNSITNIGSSAFDSCTSLTSITIPDSVTDLGGAAFENCTSLASVSIGNGVTSISNSVFYDCTNLISVSIPTSVTRIGYVAFAGCNNLNYVFYSGTEDEWSNIDFANSKKELENVIIHYNSTDHSYSDWVIDAEPSCALAGHKHRVCSVCNYTDNVKIEATANHEYSDWVVITPPSCVGNGSHSKTCLACGSVYTEEFSGTGHLNTMWITEQEPTCTVAGYKDEWCLDCGEMVGTEEIPATGHQSTMWVIELYPTCTEVGHRDEWCLDCGEIASTEEIPADGHTFSTEWTIDVAATCTEEGSKSHTCMFCGEKGDITVIAPLGHNYILTSIDDAHPHTKTFECSLCSETKQEESFSKNCGVCNFTFTNIDDATCRLTGYIGSSTTMFIPAKINGRTVSTTTTGAFKNNTTLTTVRIENGVQGLGALAFLGCSSLSKVVVPESVTSIGANAFYNCASDFTLYCYSGSYAEQYAIDNSLNYVVMDIGETDNCTIDYANELIYVSIAGLTSLDDVLYVPSSSMIFAEASLIAGNYEFLGTGSIITVFDGNDISSEYTLVVEGDTNGDSVCDALDAMHVGLASNGHRTLDGAYALAADSNADEIVDANDYQAIVNKAAA